MGMLYVKFARARSNDTVHIMDDGYVNNRSMYATLCQSSWVGAQDDVWDEFPGGCLCKKCKKSYLKDHTEEELILEVM